MKIPLFINKIESKNETEQQIPSRSFPRGPARVSAGKGDQHISKNITGPPNPDSICLKRPTIQVLLPLEIRMKYLVTRFRPVNRMTHTKTTNPLLPGEDPACLKTRQRSFKIKKLEESSVGGGKDIHNNYSSIAFPFRLFDLFKPASYHPQPRVAMARYPRAKLALLQNLHTPDNATTRCKEPF